MTINTISSVIGYTLDTYATFVWHEMLADEDIDDATEVDQVAYVADLANYQAELLNDQTDDILKRVTATGSNSPSYYNFSTDEAELMIEFNKTRLMNYASQHREEFNDYLRENFTNYDGFRSNVPNNWQQFFGEIKGDDVDDVVDRDLGVLLGWYLHREVLNNEDYLDEMVNNATDAAYDNAINLAEGEAYDEPEVWDA
jgi:hypothetical protein